MILVEKRRDGKLCKVVPGGHPGVSGVRLAQGGLSGMWGAGGGDGMGVGEEPLGPGLCLVPGPLQWEGGQFSHCNIHVTDAVDRVIRGRMLQCEN